MRSWLLGLGAVLLLAGLTGTASAADEKKPATTKKKLLVITQSKGFVHDVVKRPKPDELCLVEQILTEIGKNSGDFEAACSQDAHKEITAENLKQFDAVFFYTTGELDLSETQKTDLLDFVRSGKGFAGSHCTPTPFTNGPNTAI